MTAACSSGADTSFVSLGYIKVAWLGVVQGITELLPISSTAHMRIVPALLGWHDPGTAFSAAMQLAALVAVISYFRQDVARLATGSVSAIMQRKFHDAELRLSLWIGLGTLPILFAGAALSPVLNRCASPLRSLTVIGWACIGMACVMALAEISARHRRTVENASLRDAFLVGLAQVGALIPGVSRSGSTLSAALALGFKREEAARFSFLLGIPAIALAGLKELWELHRAGLDVHGWSVLAVGLLTASIAAFAAIWALMSVLERFSAWPFVIYRGVLGIFLLVMIARGSLG
ncbi:undecaprenyl-diphosphate phosphatase [Sphingomonas sp. A2-49]|jgi:undecaprenyl-diphosphatase|uniref:undecaprenyl-diphosphate phosphatase n=1 Tax=Sphingomonas sp. A2-49 TaxID=1391375 RepID=UPI0021D311E3|nr:undecaprenyl-diphosphate phosphatase [Sphingomonas sp. A2-49]MCU6453385.1 undecaprenyl-diphosphate phosphatase [Sphingomonas sp. A2-49]